MPRLVFDVSAIWREDIIAQSVVNGRLETEARDPPGTLICEPAPIGSGDDLTVTRFGKRFMDEGVFTPRHCDPVWNLHREME